MRDNYKIYTVDVFDIKWEGTDYYPIKLPTHIENFEIAIPIELNEDYILNRIFDKLIEMHGIVDGYNLSISQAKVKVKSMCYFSKQSNIIGCTTGCTTGC
jgi:hypothetical protein